MRDRTADLLDANQALSQLSYSPLSSYAETLSRSDQNVSDQGGVTRSIACYVGVMTTPSRSILVGLGRL